MRSTPPQPLATGDSAPLSAPNRLLALPRELRDKIYEYALAEDEGLLLIETHPKSFRGHRLYEHWVESNRLKYVCRQLYHETKGLGLGLNDLAMRSERQVESFVAFLDTCSASQQQCIRKVTLTDRMMRRKTYMSSWDWDVEALRPYGASNPCMTIHLYVNSLSCTESAVHWLVLADTILYARYLHTDHAFKPRAPSLIAVFSNPRSPRDPIPSHIRIFPGKGSCHVTCPDFSGTFVLIYGEERLKICTREFEKWQREGI